eukprot:1130962_1
MSMMKSLLFTVAFLWVISAARRTNPTQYHKRRRLSQLTRKDHQELLVPILDHETNSYSHHIHVEDARNKHLEFHFEATLPANTHIFTLNDAGHRSNITDIVCADHHMKVYPIDVDYYHQHIQSHLDAKKDVFIPGVCDKQSTKVRRVHSIHRDDDGLLLASSTVDHLAMYDEYFFEFKSDSPVHFHHDTDDHDVIRRRLEGCDPLEFMHHVDDDGDWAIALLETVGKIIPTIRKMLDIFGIIRNVFEFLKLLGKHKDAEGTTIDEKYPLACTNQGGGDLNNVDLTGLSGGDCTHCYFGYDFGVHIMMRVGTVVAVIEQYKFTIFADAKL